MTTQTTTRLMMMSAALVLSAGALGCPADDQGGDGSHEVGRLAEPPIAGVEYVTSTHSGVTNANGEFEYAAGETVEFRIGSVVLGSAAGAAQVTLYDLAGATPLTTPLETARAIQALRHGRASNPIQHAFNLATFLFSFDADNDLSNGVEIPEALGPLVSEPFVWTHKRFTETRAFARVMQQARLSGAWSAGVRLYPPRVAMMRLDEANGIEAVTRELVAERQLFDGAAYLDRAYELDAYGNRTSSAGYDTPSTGTLQFYTLAYDPDGNLTALERLQQRSRGLYTFALTAAYNEFGGLVEVDRSVNLSAPNTGDRNGHEAEQFVWNANGLRASGSGQHLITDAIMDPINAQVTYGYIYDAAGNLTTSTETWSAALADRASSYTYDADGLMLTSALASQNLTYGYDATGMPTRVTLEGSYEDLSTYDAFGNLRSLERRIFLGQGDFIAETLNLDLDGEGRVVATNFQEANGDWIRTGASYDEHGNQLTYTRRTETQDGYRYTDSLTTYTYDASGALVTAMSDTAQSSPAGEASLDGVIDYETTYTTTETRTNWSRVVLPNCVQTRFDVCPLNFSRPIATFDRYAEMTPGM